MGRGREEADKLFSTFLHLQKKGDGKWGKGGKAQTAVSFPNELNVMNEVESCKTQSVACGEGRQEAGTGAGSGRGGGPVRAKFSTSFRQCN